MDFDDLVEDDLDILEIIEFTYTVYTVEIV